MKKITILTISMLAFMTSYSVDSFSAGRPVSARSATTRRAATVSMVGNIMVSNPVVANAVDTDKSCKDAYVDCMDSLIPYVVAKNEFMKKDPVVKKLLSSDNPLRCVYDTSVADENGVVAAEAGEDTDAFGAASSVATGSKLSRMAVLYRNYNYYCKESGTDGKTCAYDSGAAAKHYAGTTSAAYFTELGNKVQSGNFDMANFGGSVLSDLGIDTTGVAMAKNADKTDSNYGIAIMASPPSFAHDAAGEYSLATNLCFSGGTQDDINKHKLLATTLSDTDQAALLRNIKVLAGDSCASAAVRNNVEAYYKIGKWKGTKAEACKLKASTNVWDDTAQTCTDTTGAQVSGLKSNYQDLNFMTPSRSCAQYEIAMQSSRIDIKAETTALLTAKSKDIEASIKTKEMANLKKDVKLNNDLAQLQNEFLKSCKDDLNSCMADTCGKGQSGYDGDFAGCVNWNGPIVPKLLTAGLDCYAPFRTCAETVIKTINPDTVSPYLKKWISNLNDNQYKQIAREIIASDVGVAYAGMLENSCKESGGFYENNFCFVKASFSGETSDITTQKATFLKGGHVDKKEAGFSELYYSLPGANFDCSHTKTDYSSSRAGWVGAVSTVTKVASVAAAATMIVATGGMAAPLALGIAAGGMAAGAAINSIGVGANGGPTSISSTIALIKQFDGVDSAEDGCGKIFIPNNWGNYISTVYAKDVTFGKDKKALVVGGKNSMQAIIPVCSKGVCTGKELRYGFTNDISDINFYKSSTPASLTGAYGPDQLYTPEVYMTVNTTKIIDDNWDRIFVDKDTNKGPSR